MLFLALLAASFDRRLMAATQREAAVLRASEEWFRSQYRNTPLPLHSLDEAGRIVQISDAWLDLLGFTREEVLGRKLTDVMTSASAELYQREQGTVRDAEHGSVAKDGREITTLLSARVERTVSGTGTSSSEA